MYVTALLMILLLLCLIIAHKPGYAGLKMFNRDATLPLRGFMALLIVAHHLGQRTEIPVLSPFTSGIGLQIVAVFFFLSGYGLCVSYSADRAKYVSGFLRKRFGKLLPKFLLLTLFMMVVYHFYSGKGIAEQAGLLMTRGITPLPHSWFIYAISYVYISFYLCATPKFSPLRTGVAFLLASMLYVIIVGCVLRFPGYWWLTLMNVNLGYFTALYEEKITDAINRRRLVCCSVMACTLFVSFCLIAKVHFIAPAWTIIWTLVQAFTVYLIVRMLGFVRWKWLCVVGVFSLELYLVHGIPLQVGQYFAINDSCLWLFTYALSLPLAFALNKCGADMFRKLRSRRGIR